jgi:chromate transporter
MRSAVAVTLWLKLPLRSEPLACAVLTAAALLLVWRFKQPPYISIPLCMALACALLLT